MKFASLVTTFATLALGVLPLPAALAQTSQQTLSYDTTYDDPSLSLASVACSDGTNGLLTKGYTTLGSLPNFPNVGGVYTVTGWNAPACGACYSVTYTSGTTSKTISVLAVDSAPEGFNLSEEAMNALTGGLAAELGRVEVTALPVDASACGL